ncbi:fumarate reductase 1 [[Candida] railenensis]|uniref:Fumarate reductase n=1 Tax=[Candida] railenensis TaxID=45579 RepID=A0A9P0W0K5_9ASCO|nr:fumarate reductase 1 [[Candida] railenensis]
MSAIVVGTGLAGLTTTLELLQRGVSVYLIEKTSRIGGNSIKASSGINGVPTEFQLDGTDSVDSFIEDTIKSGNGLSNAEMVDILAKNSASAINWLTKENNIDLGLVTKLGGHSHARTHRGSGKLPPGFAIISALSKKLDQISQESNSKLKILKNSNLYKILAENGEVTGIQYTTEEANKAISLFASNVILATGGYSADFNEERSLLSKYRPDLLDFPSTNGEQTTGDGQKIAERDVDANLIHMDKVQVHPTGFVKAGAEDSKWKFLCGELIRGIGGVLISPQTGERFVNELTTRDKVTDAIESNCEILRNTLNIDPKQKVAIIIVNEKDYLKAENHINFYLSQSLMHKSSLGELAHVIAKLNPDLPESSALSKLSKTFQTYDEFVDSGFDKSWSRKSFGTKFGDGSVIYYGLVTPVLHFTMGGIEINKVGNVINKNGEGIPNLFAVGEVSGGLHGSNRLGGSSLLECVVFGKIVAQNIS